MTMLAIAATLNQVVSVGESLGRPRSLWMPVIRYLSGEMPWERHP